MKRTLIVAIIVIVAVAVMGCGNSKDEAPLREYVKEAKEEVLSTDVTDNNENYDHIVEVDGVEIGLKDIEGYKPYIVHFIYSKEGITDGNCTDGNAYFQDAGNNILSLDDAKQQDIIADYELHKSDEMLVLYVNENKNGLSLMPAPSPGDLRLEFEGDIDTYAVLWNSAAMEKIGLGNEYKMVDLSPSTDFDGDKIVCVKNVPYEDFFYGALGDNVGKYYLFIKSVYYGEYSLIK